MLKFALATSAVLLISTASVMAQSAAAKAVLGACKGDIKEFCSTVAPGGGRIKGCMKEHLAQLSDPCKEALFQTWLNK